jgi:hypothetical protein
MEASVRKFQHRTNPLEVAFATERVLPRSHWREDRAFDESIVLDDDLLTAALERARQIGVAFVRLNDRRQLDKEPIA